MPATEHSTSHTERPSGSVVAASADELVRRPQLAAAFARRAGRSAGTRLLLYAADAAAVAPALIAVLDAAGLGGDDGPEIVLLDEGPDEAMAQLARHASAVLTAEDPPAEPLRGLPPFGGPRVSVIIPAYDYERYLAEAIDGALAQDFPQDEIEVVVVDDGSTDGTPGVIASYGDRIRSIRRPNGGLNAATDTGIAAARGELLTFLDADDTWPRDRVRLLVDALDRHPGAGLAYGDMEVVDEDGRVVHPSFRALGYEPVEGRVLGRLLLGNVISAGAMMVRASLRDRFHPIADVAPHQDWWIAARVAEVADVVAIDACVNRYRRHQANMNLGADEAGRRRLLARELPFRRWLLGRVQPGQAQPLELALALRNFDTGAELAAAGEDGVRLQAQPAAHREALRQALALIGHDDAAAAAALVRAAVADPGDAQSRRLLDGLLAAAS